MQFSCKIVHSSKNVISAHTQWFLRMFCKNVFFGHILLQWRQIFQNDPTTVYPHKISTNNIYTMTHRANLPHRFIWCFEESQLIDARPLLFMLFVSLFFSTVLLGFPSFLVAIHVSMVFFSTCLFSLNWSTPPFLVGCSDSICQRRSSCWNLARLCCKVSLRFNPLHINFNRSM